MSRRAGRALHHRRSARHRTEPDHGHSWWWWPGGAAVGQQAGDDRCCADRVGWHEDGDAVHPTRGAVAQPLHRVLQRSPARRMPQHPPVLVPDPRQGHHRRLEGGVQPRPAALIAGLPNPTGLRCDLYPLIGSHSTWTDPRGPVTLTRKSYGWPTSLNESSTE